MLKWIAGCDFDHRISLMNWEMYIQFLFVSVCPCQVLYLWCLSLCWPWSSTLCCSTIPRQTPLSTAGQGSPSLPPGSTRCFGLFRHWLAGAGLCCNSNPSVLRLDYSYSTSLCLSSRGLCDYEWWGVQWMFSGSVFKRIGSCAVELSQFCCFWWKSKVFLALNGYNDDWCSKILYSYLVQGILARFEVNCIIAPLGVRQSTTCAKTQKFLPVDT